MLPLYCKLKASPLHGIGVFALVDIKQGTKVIYEYDELVWHEMSDAAFCSLPHYERSEILDRTIFQAGQTFKFLDPNSACDFRSYMNHSDDPNTDGLYALRDIKEGEELTENYRTMGALHLLTKQHMPFLNAL